MDNEKQFEGIDFTLWPENPIIKDALIEVFLNYWKSIREPSGIPLKSSIDPIRIPKCLPYVWIYRYLAEEDTFICDLAGQDIGDVWKKNLRGVHIKDLYGKEHSEYLKTRWLHAMNNKAIIHSRHSYDDGKTATERLVCPVADDQGIPKYVFGISIYKYNPDRMDDFNPAIGLRHVKYFSIDSLTDD